MKKLFFITGLLVTTIWCYGQPPTYVNVTDPNTLVSTIPLPNIRLQVGNSRFTIGSNSVSTSLTGGFLSTVGDTTFAVIDTNSVSRVYITPSDTALYGANNTPALLINTNGQVNVLTRISGDGFGLTNTTFRAKLAGDVSVTSLTTYTNSPMSVTLPAGTNNWNLTGYIFTASGGGQVKTIITNTVAVPYCGTAIWGSGATASSTSNFGWGSTGNTFIATASAVENTCISYNVFFTTTNTCTVTLQYAQVTSSGVATTLKAGSIMVITRQ